ncbi:hypothetical protein BAUCODRAFT_27628 [Baudoinia panamericana UAMH 10762]|uniref:Uncharacterized protein n=1 Tax=Baudoinia panamericana (strain UAMH 10762) TaxID=717646 RepID=M2N067_BAUPA|nr:uncharacterized protein BAUCODRAFT_27628 [Baudoinia panamericana UAMH 10762]EMC92324.1 hypothetical protein BAUCODRAFT_27628 [Baudoinia panamericana UAMH 10762]
MAQLSTSTSTTTVVQPVTSGPPINDLQFQGYYYDSSSSWEAIRCPTSQSLTSTANFAQCCSYGATTCTTMWTSCNGNTAVGVSSAVCTYCGTMSIYERYPAAGQVPFTEIVCGNYWLASTVYRNIVTSSTSMVNHITCRPSVLICAAISVATLTSTLTSTSVSSTVKSSIASSSTPTASSSTPTASSSTPTASSSASTASSLTPTAVDSPSSTQSSSATPTPLSSPASKAWIAGAVAGPVVAIALVGLAVWLFRSRKGRRTSSNANTATTMPQHPYYGGTSGPQSPGMVKQPPEYYQHQPQSYFQPHEMSSVPPTHELPAGQ